MHYDSDLYHAQSIRWIEEYGIVKGLGNIHVRFAYNSSFFALSALYSMPYIFGQSMHSVNGMIALILSIEALRIVHAWKRKKLLLSDFARAAALFYLTLIYSDIMAPASDYAIMCTVFYIIIKWLSQLEDEQEADNVTPYALLCVAGVYTGSETGYYVDTAEALERNYTLSMHGHWRYNTLAYKDSMDIRIFVISFSGVGYILCRLEDSYPGRSIGCCGN